MIEKNEVLQYQAGSLKSAHIAFFYLSIGEQHALNDLEFFSRAHSFEGSLHFFGEDKNLASISSINTFGGDIIIKDPELRNCHIGGYFISKIIEWLKSNSQNETFQMKPLNLIKEDFGNGNENGLRRNYFYSSLGFKLKLNEDGSGTTEKTLLDDLIIKDSWKKNIKEFKIQEYVRNLSENETQLTNQNLNLLSQNNQYNKNSKILMGCFQENRRLKKYLMLNIGLLGSLVFYCLKITFNFKLF